MTDIVFKVGQKWVMEATEMGVPSNKWVREIIAIKGDQICQNIGFRGQPPRFVDAWDQEKNLLSSIKHYHYVLEEP